MKKIIILILWYCTVGLSQSNAQYNFPEETGWNFIIERIFNGENNEVPIYQGDINIILINFKNNENQLIVEDIIKELRSLIPNKITTSTIGHGNLILEIVPKSSGMRFYSNQRIFKERILSKHHKLQLENLTKNEKKKILEYSIIRSLCVLQNNDYHTFIGNGILDYKNQSNPLSSNFTDADKFLIQNLYTPDFLEKAKHQIVNKYSWRYYMNFAYKNEVKWFAVIFCTLIIFLVFIASYKTILIKKFRKTYFNYLLPGLVIVYTSFIVLEAYHRMTSMAVGMKPAFLSPIINNLVWLIPISILYLLERRFVKPTQSISKQLKLKAFFTISLLFITIVPFMIFIDKPHLRLILTLVAILIFFSRMLFLYLQAHSEAMLHKKDVELSKLRELKAQAEVASLHARINPHFLYNSLNSIAALAHSSPDKTEQMALSLSDLFRHNINRKNEATSSIQDEIDAVKAYLEIEQIRFGDRMTYSIEVDKDLEQVQIPRNIIQPLVENAIKHGMSKVSGNGFITINIHKEEEYLTIQVQDNGPDFPDGLVSGYGLQSIHDILQLSYGKNASLNWENHPVKMISISIKHPNL
ncbi:sensor histidine kinase [Zhouia amylolytica]|uniref:sensor histidine kinase n=1 Tax=Zhouia amylolytica TaxID=376730 RepID=UPI0020CF327E|nr:histidine kinase [Zhouia amylolytica]MCQ0111404.1 histidine kinase [Zhouia amylolytica]